MKKWLSGMYADLYDGKYVQVEGKIVYGAAGGVGLQFDSEFMFSLISLDQSQVGFVMVQAPRAQRDNVFSYKVMQPARVYGHVTNQVSTSVFTGQQMSSTLIIELEKIEPLGL